jgi:hypothetical protein
MPTTNNQFQLTFPDGWEDRTVYTFFGPHDSGVQHNIILAINPHLPEGMILKTYALDQLDLSARHLPGFELINESPGALPSGVPVYTIVYRYSPSDDLTYFQKQFHMIVGDKGFSFTSTFSKKTLKTIANDVDKIVSTLRVGPR